MAKKAATKKTEEIEILSYAEQRKQLEAEYEMKLLDAKSELAKRFAADAYAKLDARIQKGNDNVLKSLWSDYEAATKASGGASASKGGTRQRRSSDQVKADAEAILEIVKAAGADGIKAKDLKAAMAEKGVKPSGPSIVDFVKAQLGHTIKPKGERAATVYHF